MFSNAYKTKEGLIVTEISGGRPHFPAREPVRAVSTYEYVVERGDNFHSMSASIFADDAYWWVLDDLNPPKDAFAYQVGDIAILPQNIVAENRNKKRIF